MCEQIAGSSLEALFARAVRGRGSIDFDSALKAVGLRVQRSPINTPLAFLGGNFATDPLGVKISNLPSDTPAYAQGLSASDIIIAIDDLRVTSPDDAYKRVYSRNPGDTLRIAVLRADRLLTIPVKLEGRVLPDYRLLPLPNQTEAQKKLYQGWIGPVSESEQ